MSRSLQLLLWCIATIVSLNLCIGTGLIPDWGRWYSSSLPYRMQTDALLGGRFALSTSPTAIEHDMAWAMGGVQQVWGLGVACWRLPFEVLARSTGQAYFPDRLTLAIAMMIVTYAVLRVFTAPIHVRSVEDWLTQCARAPSRVAAAALLVLFPPVITLCLGPFNVYEEAVVYGYYLSIALLAGIVAFARKPSLAVYVTVSLLAGFAPFVRPTMGAYGLATIAVAWFVTRQANWSWWKSGVGPTLFGLGCTLLMWSNWVRFGAGFEFGHQLNHSALDLNYLLRFPTPFDEEPLWSAAKELLGSVFFVRELNGFDVYRDGIVAWQSATPRWRHYYHTTFDLSFLVVTVVSWGWAVWTLIMINKAKREPAILDQLVPAAWSLISIVMLAVFYLRLPAISSRYMLDFAPGICAAFVGCLLAWENWLGQANSTSSRLRTLALAALAGWWFYEIATAEHSFQATATLSRREVASYMERRHPEFQGIPEFYAAEAAPAEATGVVQNGHGWYHPSGETQAMVVLFVSNPEKLRLTVAPVEGTTPTNEQYTAIRAKIGWEFLVLESIESMEHERVLTFSLPSRTTYSRGIQPAFIAFLPPHEFRQETSPFRLLRVEW